MPQPGELGKFLEVQRRHKFPDARESLNYNKKIFLEMSEFMGDSSRFPNPRLNTLGQNLTSLMRSGELKVGHISNYPSLGIASDVTACFVLVTLSKTDFESTPYVLFGNNFVKDVEIKTVEIVQMVALMANQVRDYQKRRIYDSQSLHISAERGYAHEAEALLTLIEMARKEKISLTLDNSQRALLSIFPKGIDSFKEPILQ
ncbi:MAG: hypothetical protein WC744_00590 [Patescibacteria group bacterium]|jgi:hypothetical protein